MRNKFIYYSIKIHALGFNKVLESIFCFLLWMQFCLQKVVMLKEVLSQLVRGQVNMADEAKLCTPIHSTFKASVVQCAIGCYHREELCPFC